MIVSRQEEHPRRHLYALGTLNSVFIAFEALLKSHVDRRLKTAVI